MVNQPRTQRAPERARSTEHATAWALLGTIAGTFITMMAAIVWIGPISFPAADVGALPGSAWVTTGLALVAAVASLLVLLLSERLTGVRAMVSTLALLMSFGVLFGDVLASTGVSLDARDAASVAVDAPTVTDAATLCAELPGGGGVDVAARSNRSADAGSLSL